MIFYPYHVVFPFYLRLLLPYERYKFDQDDEISSDFQEHVRTKKHRVDSDSSSDGKDSMYRQSSQAREEDVKVCTCNYLSYTVTCFQGDLVLNPFLYTVNYNENKTLIDNTKSLLFQTRVNILQSPVSNGNQIMMNKDIASLTDRALIIKQEIEKMKMRKVSIRVT